MNIQVQCCGLVLMLFLLYFFLHQKTIDLNSQRGFLRLLIFSIISVVLDFLSVIAIVERAYIPNWLLLFICKVYIVSLVLSGYLGLLYACTDLYATVSKKQKVLCNCLIICSSVLIFCVPLHLYHNGNIVYSFGPGIVVAYTADLFFVALCTWKLTHNKQLLNRKRLKAIIIWISLWLIASSIEFFFHSLLLIAFASALGMMVLFFEMENPEANLDRETGFFNSHVLMEYMKQCYQLNEPFYGIFISLEKYHHNNTDIKQIRGMLPEFIHFLNTIPNAKVFKNIGWEFVLLFKTEDDYQHAFDQVHTRFKENWSDSTFAVPLTFNPLIILFPDSSVTEDAEEIFRMLHYIKYPKISSSEMQIIYLDKKLVAQKRNEDSMESTIISAINENRVEVFYQPIYSTVKQKFVSAEALVRIRNRDHSIIPPAAFINVAEDTGLINQLGEIVFKKTCQFITDHNITQYGIEYIEVNLSVRQCEEHNLADIYRNIMQQYGISPNCINLEITESASILHKNSLLQNMNLLISHGVSFSLDDFGNGQSNLNYIVDMPVSIVKFDRDMTQAYFENAKAKCVMNAALQMAHEMNLKVVSEGVETAEQLSVLSQLGIDFIQGFYFSKPLPTNEFLAFIKSN